MLKLAINRFRLISYIEGISYLILLFIAMPIKYILDNPYFVKIVGMSHGVLFIIFVIFLLETMRKNSWTLRFALETFVLSLIPFGSFLIEKRIKEL
ncbi:MAG: DUF3817 domain-containing protein [Campylobacteraceae bacterium]|nr:DUF3817 domain-containing protein [Campylobacteraceae bacterium]